MNAAEALELSKPFYSGFSPDVIPYQRELFDLVDEFDYSSGTLEILLSGSFGSAKSIAMAHLVVRHCVENAGACVAICRRGLPDLKKTIWLEILSHMGEDFEEKRDYEINRAEMTLTFRNGSQVICCTWADKRYKKFRSLKLSMLVFEEIDDTDDEDQEAFKQLKARLRRIPHVRECLLIAASNPDAPGHWVYKHFIEGSRKFHNRFVLYSKTEDNPFLDQIYIQELRRDMSPKEARRYLDGEWIEISGEVIYSEYSSDVQYLRNDAYEINQRHPVVITYDFNIAENKPMSALMLQYIGDVFHVFAEVIIDGGRTVDTIDEFSDRGLLNPNFRYTLCGDAAGKHRDTRSLRSDYDIILSELRNRNLVVAYHVPPSNPALRLRHNRVNAYCLNALGERRLYLYRNCATIDEGLRLTKLKPGANYVEDDSKRFQHCTTALGYAVVTLSNSTMVKPQGTVQL